MEENKDVSNKSSNQNLYARLPKSLTTVTTFSKLIALFLFILLPLAGFMVGSRFQAKLDSSNNQQPGKTACTQEAKICPDGSSVGRTGPKCEFSPCPTGSKTDGTSTWKTYKNTDYGFYFKYPDKWGYQIQKNSFSDSKSTILLAINFGKYEYEDPGGSKISPTIPPAYVSLTIFKYNKDIASPLDTFVKDGSYSTPAKVSNIMVNGIEAKKVEHLACQSGNCEDVLIFRSGTIFDFFVQNGDGDLNQILSTFTFAPTPSPIPTIIPCGNGQTCPTGMHCGSYTPPCPDGKMCSLSEIQACVSDTPTPTCEKRPACLDATPRCMIPEPANGWCP